ncbi:MAG: aquaporin, partial [bacterium]
MMQETIGTFVFVIFYMIVTDERLYFSKESIINCLIIASSYVAARSIVEGSGSISTFGACLNPAVAVGISLVSLLSDPGSTFAWFWIYYFMPLAGSLIAVVFFRLVYLKTQL